MKKPGKSTKFVATPTRPTAAKASNSQRLTEVRIRLAARIDPDYAEKIRELVPTGSGVMGVRVPVIRELARDFCSEQPDLDLDAACDLYDACCNKPCREEMLFAQAVLERFKRKIDSSIWPRIDQWIDSIDNWEVCDQLSKNIAAPIVARELDLAADLLAWTASPNPWRRRFALATTTSLNQGGRSNVALTLSVCDPLMRDEHVMVQKALGWALREAAKKDAAAVERFLRKWKAKALPRILREAGV